ncbi:MAG: asparagine synthase (glutamine-hydrolyzing) [Bacteroidia bacterium]|nr:asparagine synthase (glutamine-hydrolyzing) [Bacteroidia bacterium]
MCGIAGILTLAPEKINVQESLLYMTKKLRHRGPDDEGFFLANENESECFSGEDTPAEISESKFHFCPQKKLIQNQKNFSLGFCHRRLSIIDLSAGGHQPMSIDNGKYWITYNGEIYNYVELREELEKKGHRFITRSDTEVLLYAYKEWGIKCLDRFNGMWSFVLYDTEKKKLIGARDRFGVKPFYYYHTKEVFCFASEQKALVNQPFVTTGINEQALHDFFVHNEMEYAPQGLFNNILELFPGNYFELNTKNLELKIEKYFFAEVNTSFEKFDEKKFEHYKNETTDLLVNAVKLRMRSDVKVGSCLSGGIDSSAIVGIMQALSGKENPPELFTAVFPGKEIDEEKWAEEVAKKNGGKNTWNKISPTAQDLWKDLDDMVYSQDLPLWSSSTYAQFSVMKLARQNNIKVLLDGQGGDELFGGYIPYYLSFWNELKSNGEKKYLENELQGFSHLGKASKFQLKENIKGKIDASSSGFLKTLKDPNLKFLNSDFLRSHVKPPIIKKEYSSLNKHLQAEFENTRLKLYLKCEDRCSMWHSVESRTPFADDIELIKKVMGLPGIYKIKNGQLKYLLREAAKKYLPEKIYNRKDKMGYVTPHNSWMHAMNETIRTVDFSEIKPYLNYKRFGQKSSQLFLPLNDAENFLAFKILTFSRWKSLFLL